MHWQRQRRPVTRGCPGQVQARVLQPPTLFYKDRRDQPLATRVSAGAWNLRDVRLH